MCMTRAYHNRGYGARAYLYAIYTRRTILIRFDIFPVAVVYYGFVIVRPRHSEHCFAASETSKAVRAVNYEISKNISEIFASYRF